MAFRFTKKNIEETLKLNEGFTSTTNYESRNFRESRNYKIKDGKLFCHSEGKAPFDGRFSQDFECDTETTRRFLRDRKNRLNLPKE